MSNEQQEIEYPDWLPKELEGALIHQNALLPILFPELGLNVNGQITPILTDPRMEKAWATMKRNKISLVFIAREVERIISSWDENLHTKTKNATEFADWKKDVKRTARKLGQLILRTPYERILSDLDFTLTETRESRGAWFPKALGKNIQDMTIHDFLLYMEVVDHQKKDSPIEYLALARKKGKKNAIEKDIVIQLHYTFRNCCGRPLNNVTASIINALYGYKTGTDKPLVADSVKKVVENFERSQKKL